MKYFQNPFLVLKFLELAAKVIHGMETQFQSLNYFFFFLSKK